MMFEHEFTIQNWVRNLPVKIPPRTYHEGEIQKATSARVHSHPWVEMLRPGFYNGWHTMSGSCPNVYTLYHLPSLITNDS